MPLHLICQMALQTFPGQSLSGTDVSRTSYHGQVTIIFVVSVCLFVCAEFLSAVFDPISIQLGHKNTCYMSGSSCVP